MNAAFTRQHSQKHQGGRAATARLLTAVALGFLLSVAASAETKILENFTLIDGTGRPPVRDAALVIVDGRIQYAGPKAGMKAPDGAERVDLTGKYVMPGIINLHGHLGNTIDLAQRPENFTRENVGKQLNTYASYGVTSMLSMGSDAMLVDNLRTEQRAGRPSSTRIFTAGRGFTGKGGYPTPIPGMSTIPSQVETPEQVKQAVDELAARKVDLVKIWVDDHFGEIRKIPMEMCKAIIDNAHAHGLKVAAHVFYLEDAKYLVKAGLDALAHSVRDQPVDDELIAEMKRRGAWQLAATLTREASTFVYAQPHPSLEDPFFTRSVPPHVIEALKSPARREKQRSDPHFSEYPGILEMAQKNLKRLHDAGVNVGMGTDSGPPARFSGYFEHWEMELMVDAALTPMQVIQASTQKGAQVLGVTSDVGTLEPGRWADLIVLARNPLDNIRNTRSLETVWIAGRSVQQ